MVDDPQVGPRDATGGDGSPGSRAGAAADGETAGDKAAVPACAACGTACAAAARFCPRCGTGLFEECPKCGRENRAGVKLCGGCGVEIGPYKQATEALERAQKHLAAGRLGAAQEALERGMATGCRGEEFEDVRGQLAQRTERMDELRRQTRDLLEQTRFEAAEKTVLEALKLDPQDEDFREILEMLPEQMRAQRVHRTLNQIREHLADGHFQEALAVVGAARRVGGLAEGDVSALDALEREVQGALAAHLAQASGRRWRRRGMQAAVVVVAGVLIWQILLCVSNASHLQEARNRLAQGDLAATAQILGQTPDWLAFGKVELGQRLREAWVSQVEDMTGKGEALEAWALADEGRKTLPDETRLDYLGDEDRAEAHVKALGDEMRKMIDAGGMDDAGSAQAAMVTGALERLGAAPAAGELRGRVAERLAALQAKAAYEAALRGYDQAQLAQLAGDEWAKVQKAAAAAGEAGTDWKAIQGKYDEARAALPAAAAAAQAETDRRGAVKAKTAYEAALRGYDQAPWARFAGTEWAKVQQAVTAAGQAGADSKVVQGKYDEARAMLPGVAAAAQAEMARQETAAAVARAAYEMALRGYDPGRLARYAAAEWAKVEEAAGAAREAGTDWVTARSKYDEARDLLPAAGAAAQLESDRQAAAKAKADYETALKGYDGARLAQFGGGDWERVLQAVRAAESAGQDWKTVALRYDDAQALLAGADRSAAFAAAQRKIADLLASAKANDSKEKGKTALAALEELLGLDPQNAEALALQKKIADYYVPPKLLAAPFNAAAAREAQQRWANFLDSKPEITNTIGMKLALIPPGSFTMGTPGDEAGRDNDEGPAHKVTLTKPVYLGITEVTQAQWKSVMGHGDNPSTFKGDDLPVEEVSWNDAVDFCSKLSQKEGQTYRLPTEAEWEYACRAGTTGSYSTGEGDTVLQKAGWYAGNSGSKTHAPGQKEANAWGLWDMHGNVWEWCADWYGPYVQEEQTDPAGPVKGTARVLRGGSWLSVAQRCRSGYRTGFFPDRPYDPIGFRMVLEWRQP